MKVIFLDIDGVLQPLDRQTRFEHMNEVPDLCKELNRNLNNGFDYVVYIEESSSNPYDVAAVYYDWGKPSVNRLRHILNSTGAKIVLSSDWREGGMERMRGMLGIHHLENYLANATYFISRHECNKTSEEKRDAWKPITDYLYKRMSEMYPSEESGWSWKSVNERTVEIREYLDRHPEITSFVSLDDRNLEKGLLERFIWTNNHISKEDMENSIRILNMENGPFLLEESLKPEGLQAWREKFVIPYFPTVIH